MAKSAAVTLEKLMSCLHKQGLEIASLRASLDTQFLRIVQIQAELDVLPASRKKRQRLSLLLTTPPSHNGNHGRHD